MTDQTAHQPLTDQMLDEIEGRAASLYEYATLTDQPFQADADQLTGEDVPALLAEVRRLRPELGVARATVFAEVANELEGIDFHPNAKATCTDLCRLLAGRFRRKGLDAITPAPAAVVSSAAETPGSAR